MHPFPAEHDQQQAHALDVLKEADSFILIHFPEKQCDNPFCEVMHQHRSTRVIASCANRDLHYAMEALGEEIMLTASINAVMALSLRQRKQVAAMLLDEEAESFVRFDDDEA